MNLFDYKGLAAILIFVTSSIAIIYPIKTRAYPAHHPLLELADAVASGIFLGAALFHMLPESIAGFQEMLGHVHYPIAELCCASGFMLLLFFERLSVYTSGIAHSTHIPYAFIFILIIHALIEGAVLGINTTLSTAMIIFFAILAHKSSESFALAVILNRSHLSLKNVILLVGLFSLMTPFGILLGMLISDAITWGTGQLLAATFNAFAAGSFLYMSTLHHVNHHASRHQNESLREYGALFSGLAIMAMIALWT